jgi:hypothetical protein
MSNAMVPQPAASRKGLAFSPLFLRLASVLLLLATMLFALWYDYFVARTAVLEAYERISKKNIEMNRASGRVSMINTDVQAVLGKKPSRTFNEGPYRIEVFSWVGGLPFRTHDLYTVYVSRGNDFVFMMEYVYQLPVDELSPRRVQLVEDPGIPVQVDPNRVVNDSLDSPEIPAAGEPHDSTGEAIKP